MFNTPTLWRRAIVFAAREAGRRGQELGPEYLLLGLLRDARDPAGTDLYPNERRKHAYLGRPSVVPTRPTADRAARSVPGHARRLRH